jgi:hypothetical protein
MNDNKQPYENDSQGTMRTSRKSYNFLVKLSKRLGVVATKSFVDVRSFLNQEITLSPAERFLNTMPIMKRKPTDDAAAVGEAATQATLDSAANLKKVVEQSHEVLASANTVFPVTLFPDTVYVDRTKVTIVRRNFFWSSDVMSIRIEDVLNVSASVGPLFGSLTVASRVMSTIDHFQINHFWRNDAMHLKHIIQGYVIAQHNNIDTAHLNKDDLVKTLQELGHDSNS